MNKRILHIAMVALLAVGGFGLMNNTDVVLTDEAIAVSGDQTVSAACTDLSTTAYVPTAVATTVTWSAVSISDSPSHSCTTTLTGPVQGDSVTCLSTLLSDGKMIAHYISPKIKVAGLQCKTSSDKVKLEAHGDGTDGSGLNIYIGNLADSDTADIAAGDQVDDNTGASKAAIFGGSEALITNTSLFDGTDDDNSTNGEVIFGSTETEGGTETKLKFDVTNYNVDAATDVETLTFTQTPGS